MAFSEWTSGLALIMSAASLAIAYNNRLTILRNEKISYPRIEFFGQSKSGTGKEHRIVRVRMANDPDRLWTAQSIKVSHPGSARLSRCGDPFIDGLGCAIDYEPIEWVQEISIGRSDTFLLTASSEVDLIFCIAAKSDHKITVTSKVKIPALTQPITST